MFRIRYINVSGQKTRAPPLYKQAFHWYNTSIDGSEGHASPWKKGGVSTKQPHQEWMEEILTFIDDFREEHQISPTVREIEAGTGIARSIVGRYLVYMREQGMLDYSGFRSVTTEKTWRAQSEVVEVPVLGRVSCGIPKFAEENIEEYVRLPVSLFGRGEFFILRANGTSMIGAGIKDGDPVLIRRQETAEPGQVVVALVGDEATLKRFYPDPDRKRVRLHPENSQFEDLYTEDCIIQGVAVKVLNDIV